MEREIVSMKISFCTTVFKRLFQLKQTLPHNVKFTKVGEVEINILAYNDPSIRIYLEKNFSEYLSDGRIVLSEIKDMYKPIDGSAFACGYVKHLVHSSAKGKILFNLDADNYIDKTLMRELNTLQEHQLLVVDPRTVTADGRAGRIGIHKTKYDILCGYRDMGRSDDIDFCRRAILLGLQTVYNFCNIVPIPNVNQEDYFNG